MTPSELKAARATLGWSQEKLAQALGMSGRGAVWRWESGENDIPGPAATAVRALLDGWRPQKNHKSAF